MMGQRAHRTGWTHVAFVASMTDQDTQYEIKRRDSDGHLGCGCTAYQFSRGTKTCKHLEALLSLGTPSVATSVQTVHKAAARGEQFTVVRRAISFGPITADGLR